MLVVILSGCSAKNDTAPTVQKETVASESDTSLDFEDKETTIEFKLKSGVVYYRNKIKYPYFLGNSEVEKSLNEGYQDYVDKCKENNVNYDELYENLVDQGVDVDNNLPYYDDFTSEVTYNKNGIISVKEVSVMWSGGAHPYHTVKGRTYEVSTSKELSYTDIIDGDEEQIDKILRHYLEEAIGDFKESQFKKLKNDTQFVLCDEGLCFFLWMGDAVDETEVIIPFTDDTTYIISADELLNTTDDEQEETKPAETVKETKAESDKDKNDNSDKQQKASYKNVINDAIKESEAFSSYEDPQGVLYDIDSNGVDELIMIFNSTKAKNPYDGSKCPGALYSVYTIADNKVVPLIEKELLFTIAGGPSGGAYILENGSQTLLGFDYSESNPAQGNDWYVGGDWNFYELNGTSMNEVKYVEYATIRDSSNNIKYESSTAKVDGSQQPYEDFESWLYSYSSTCILESYGRDDSTSLKTLLKKIK